MLFWLTARLFYVLLFCCVGGVCLPVLNKQRPVTLTRSPLARALAIIFSVGALLFLLFNYSLFNNGSNGFRLAFYLGSLFLAVVTGPLFLVRFELSETGTRRLSLGIFFGAAFPLFMMMEAFDLNGIFSVYPSAFLFNLLLIWLICWILYSLCNSFVPLYSS